MEKTQKHSDRLLHTLLLLLAIVVSAVMALSLSACTPPGGGGGGPLSALPEDDYTPADGEVRLTVVYFRPKADYTDWNFWLWDASDGGTNVNDPEAPCLFDERPLIVDGNEFRWLRVTVKNYKGGKGDNAIGFIPRRGDWAEKDIEADRFIPTSMIKDGRATVYIAQAREPVYATLEECVEAATSKKLDGAYFSALDTVSLDSGSFKITKNSVFKVKDTAGNLVKEFPIEGSNYVGKTYATIKLDAPIDLTKEYVISDEPASGFDKNRNFLSASLVKSPLYGTKSFNDAYAYDGVDLGATYTAAKTTFKVWSPVATEVKLNVYAAGEGGEAVSSDAMTKGDKGVWSIEKDGDLNGKYYTYSVTAYGNTAETIDPYAKSAGRDGKRGMVIDMSAANVTPDGWEAHKANAPTLRSYSEAVIYEAHLRDLTINPNSGVSAANRGKFLGLTEDNTKITVDGKDYSTGLAYLKELGVKQVHFQPLFDFASVKEDFNQATYNKDGEFNWGYDPLNYNVPEGSYSSDPADGTKRVKEMREMVKALHDKGIQVIMDVVYNHVSSINSSSFNAVFPGYYFRYNNNGQPYNGSGCGNETASDHAMFRKFMIESLVHWTEEYDIDGFRFDLMGLHDIDTMNAIYDALEEINPDVMLYGEGWTGGTSGLDSKKAATLANASKIPDIALFNDVIRDGLKGSVFNIEDTGYVSGKTDTDAAVYVGAAGATDALPDDVWKRLKKTAFAAAPTQSVNYVSAHDNSALWDKLNASVNKDEATLKRMNKLAAFSVLTSQGPAFFLAGEEFLRSKPTEKTNTYDNRPNKYLTNAEYYFSDNSYKSPDSVNAIDWSLRAKNNDMVEYYKALIGLKTSGSPFFTYRTTAEIEANVKFIDTAAAGLKDGVAVYGIKAGDGSNGMIAVIIINANAEKATVGLPQTGLIKYDDPTKITDDPSTLPVVDGKTVEIDGYSAMMLSGAYDKTAFDAWTYSVTVATAA